MEGTEQLLPLVFTLILFGLRQQARPSARIYAELGLKNPSLVRGALLDYLPTARAMPVFVSHGEGVDTVHAQRVVCALRKEQIDVHIIDAPKARLPLDGWALHERLASLMADAGCVVFVLSSESLRREGVLTEYVAAAGRVESMLVIASRAKDPPAGMEGIRSGVSGWIPSPPIFFADATEDLESRIEHLVQTVPELFRGRQQLAADLLMVGAMWVVSVGVAGLAEWAAVGLVAAWVSLPRSLLRSRISGASFVSALKGGIGGDLTRLMAVVYAVIWISCLRLSTGLSLAGVVFVLTALTRMLHPLLVAFLDGVRTRCLRSYLNSR